MVVGFITTYGISVICYIEVPFKAGLTVCPTKEKSI
jgi:hypothetical protein